MNIQQNKSSVLLPSLSQRSARWESALHYYRSRGVLLVSYCRYWEEYGFVQRTLAKILSENGVPVIWIDGFEWRPHHPVIPWPNENLKVIQMLNLPGRRLEWIRRLGGQLQEKIFQQHVKSLGGNPIIWVQGGTDERFAQSIPYVDVLSTFDDPYRSELRSLASLAKVILCQNSYSLQMMRDEFAAKCILALPPVELDGQTFDSKTVVSYPKLLPEKKMGYVGAFRSEDYDLALFEKFIQRFPNWGFVLGGRTDREGETKLKYLDEKYPNFCHLPWVERSQVGNVWKSLEVALLLYKPRSTQDGAFPTKVVEATYFGVPSVGTRVPKTQDLEGFFPRSTFPEDLFRQAVLVTGMDPNKLASIHRRLKEATDPVSHLCVTAEQLQTIKLKATA